MSIAKQGIRVRVRSVPSKGDGSYGFAEQCGCEKSTADDDADVFVHMTELGEGSLVRKGDEYMVDVKRTEKGLRAVNIGNVP